MGHDGVSIQRSAKAPLLDPLNAVAGGDAHLMRIYRHQPHLCCTALCAAPTAPKQPDVESIKFELPPSERISAPQGLLKVIVVPQVTRTAWAWSIWKCSAIPTPIRRPSTQSFSSRWRHSRASRSPQKPASARLSQTLTSLLRRMRDGHRCRPCCGAVARQVAQKLAKLARRQSTQFT